MKTLDEIFFRNMSPEAVEQIKARRKAKEERETAELNEFFAECDEILQEALTDLKAKGLIR